METETITWSEFPNGGKVIVEQILGLEEICTSTGAGGLESKTVYNDEEGDRYRKKK